MRLKDKIAIITGGGVGIGRAFSLGLSQEGAKVVAADINFEAAQEVVKEIERRGREALALKTDVSDVQSTQEMAKRTVERFGKIDILFNNAGLFVALGPARPWDQIDVEEWDRVMAVNLKGLFLCSRAVVPYMLKQGKGKIINISSGTAYRGNVGRIHYVTSKAGVLGFTRALARELAGKNINVNTIAPGSTLHKAVLEKGDMGPEVIKQFIAQRCIKREMYPEDLVGTAVFLSSDESDMICGETIIVDGGMAFN